MCVENAATVQAITLKTLNLSSSIDLLPLVALFVISGARFISSHNHTTRNLHLYLPGAAFYYFILIGPIKEGLHPITVPPSFILPYSQSQSNPSSKLLWLRRIYIPYASVDRRGSFVVRMLSVSAL